MDRDELEILITQSLDGLVSPEEQARLDGVLARDPEAARLMEEYRALDGVLKAAPVPAVDFERLEERISAAVHEAGEPALESCKFPAWAVWTGRLGAAAVAACLLLATGVWLAQQQRGGRPGGGTPVASGDPGGGAVVSVASSTQPSPPALAGTVQVAVMPPEEPVNLAAGVAVEIGPSAGMAKLNLPAREALTPPRSTVAIDSAVWNAQDSDHSPFR